MKREKSALLELLNSRESWKLPPHRLPEVDKRALEEALSAYKLAEDSDPHAYSRMRLYIMQGFELPSDILRKARSRIAMRAREPREGIEALASLKRKVDEDRAWNQYHADEYLEAAE